MRNFAKVTKLSNVGGRADYISNPKRQESIVIASAAVDWKPYQEFEMAHQKTDKRNNEGREVILALPNEWALLPEQELHRRAQQLAVEVVGKETDMQWAVHWNKAHTNLHIHILFSERQREKNPGVWDRDVYLTNEGKVARRKADRARNEDGSFKPPIHKKGDRKPDFTAKNPEYKKRSWVVEMKARAMTMMTERWGVHFPEPPLLHEYHEGKGKEAPKIREKNVVIRELNRRLDVLEKQGDITKIVAALKGVLKQGKIPVLYRDPETSAVHISQFTTPRKALLFTKRTSIYAKEELAVAAPSVTDQRKPTPQQPEKATSAEPAERQKAPDFTALCAAAREYYRETSALHDTRKPIDPAVQNAPSNLQAAMAALQEARNRESFARYELRHCRFWEKDKKQSAQRDLYLAQVDCRTAFDTIVSYGVTAYEDGVKMDGITVDMERLQHLVEWKVKDLQGNADQAARFARPANVPYGNPERHRAAQERFEQLCREIPPEYRNAARNAIQATLEGEDKGAGMGTVRAIETLNKAVAQKLPAQKQHEQTQTKERPSGWER